VLVAHGDGFVRRLGLPPGQRDRLQRFGTHVRVAATRISID